MGETVDYANVPFLCIPDARDKVGEIFSKDQGPQPVLKDARPGKGTSSNPCNKDDPFKPMKVGTELPPMKKIVSILPGFFHNGFRLPQSTSPETVSILAAVLYLHDGTGVKELPIYRHTFPANDPTRGDNFVTSFYPLIPSDKFSTKGPTSDGCFGMRDQNLAANRFDLSILFQVVDETFGDSKFSWLAPANEEPFSRSKDEYTRLVAESKRALPVTSFSPGARTPGTARGAEETPAAQKTSAIDAPDADIVKPSWMKGGKIPVSTLAPGYIVPLGPSQEDDKRMAAVSKLYLQAFITEQTISLSQVFDGAPHVRMLDDSGVRELGSGTTGLGAELALLKQNIGPYLEQGLDGTGPGVDLQVAPTSAIASPKVNEVQSSAETVKEMGTALSKGEGQSGGGTNPLCATPPPKSMSLKDIASGIKDLAQQVKSHSADTKDALPALMKLSDCIGNTVTLLQAYKSDTKATKLADDLSKMHDQLAKKHGAVQGDTSFQQLIEQTQKDDEAEIAALTQKLNKSAGVARVVPRPAGSTQASRDKLEAEVEARKQQQELRQEKLKAMQQKVEMKVSEEKGSEAAQADVTKMGTDSLYRDPIIWRRKLELTLLHACITAERKCSDKPGMASNCEQCFQDISSKMLNPNTTTIAAKSK